MVAAHMRSAQGQTILVVEDETFIRLMAADSLADCGFDVIQACDAAEALHILETHEEVDILFTDINMPGEMDGLQLANMVSARRPDVRLVVTSGAERILAAPLPGSGIYLAKPYRPDELAAAMRVSAA